MLNKIWYENLLLNIMTHIIVFWRSHITSSISMEEGRYLVDDEKLSNGIG